MCLQFLNMVILAEIYRKKQEQFSERSIVIIIYVYNTQSDRTK